MVAHYQNIMNLFFLSSLVGVGDSSDDEGLGSNGGVRVDITGVKVFSWLGPGFS